MVAHLQIGLLLQTLGAPFREGTGERAGIYLTNALTGWAPAAGPRQRLLFPELEVERDAAARIKQEVPILVILGNPPYNAFAGISPDQEQGLVEPYKVGLRTRWGIRKFNLDDLYVRFFRLAERRLARPDHAGVICYISNFSYLSDPSFVVMRERLLAEFDHLWFDSLNGDSRETGKLTPEGKPDPSVFSTEFNREGIRLGTAIGLFVRTQAHPAAPVVRYRDFWGVTKRADLLASLGTPDLDGQYAIAQPTPLNRYAFRPGNVTAAYSRWPQLVELCAEAPISGLQEMRRGGLMDIDAQALAQRMQRYFDPTVDWATFVAQGSKLAANAGRFTAQEARTRLGQAESFAAERIVRYALYPLDLRWAYHSNRRPLWNEPRPALVAQHWSGNRFLITRLMAERPGEQVPLLVTSALPDYHLLRPNTVAIPLRLRSAARPAGASRPAQPGLFDETPSVRANLALPARTYLQRLGISNPDSDVETAELVWMHALAIGYAPAYLAEHGPAIRQDWPRVPLPTTAEALRASAELGRQVAALLDPEQPVEEVTTGPIRATLRILGGIQRRGGGQLDPAQDLALTAGWGHPGKDGITMPGQGQTQPHPYTTAERQGLDSAAIVLLGGEPALDVYLNDRAYWGPVPPAVWTYTIGGYQVLKKWLSYRETALLGRPLSVAEAREVTAIVRRLAALLLLGPALDANYRHIAADSYAWNVPPGPKP